MIELIDFDRDDAAQELLGYAGITEAYEKLLSRVSLKILRESVPDSEIVSIRFVRSAGNHPRFKVGGEPIDENSSKIKLQDMRMPFDLEITIDSSNARHQLKVIFTIECSKMDEEQENEYLLEILEQNHA